MKGSFRSFFGISGKEVSGFLLLSCILLSVLFIPDITNYLGKAEIDIQERDQEILDSLLVLLEKDKQSDLNYVEFDFDPNSLSKDSFMLLGFSNRTASQIVNYRNNGGQFRYRNDLYKIYSIDSVLLDSLISLIQLPEKPVISEDRRSDNILKEKPYASKVVPQVKEVPLPSFNLNTADTATLQTISGIGSVLSKRIVSFRSKLGGFVSMNQLYEVYNLDSTVVSKIEDQSYLEEGFRPVTIEINTLNQEDLKKHPYISAKQARLISAYRDQHGSFLSKDDLGKVYLMDTTTINKLLPYISWGAVE